MFFHEHRLYVRGNLKKETALVAWKTNLILANRQRAPQHHLNKTETGSYHFMQFVGSDHKSNIVRETFSAPPEIQYKYAALLWTSKMQQ
ncbi:MAG TPA: hypothetical protein DCP92_07620 [Nitrospiraceae bacterium]|jgi:hypothetical protein|nr:hypothetical protein [Nitrospiraceae bacterium]